MDNPHAQRVLKAVSALRATLHALVEQVDHLGDLLEQGPTTTSRLIPVEVKLRGVGIRIDRSSYTVKWDGRSCFLGSTQLFLLIERLARRPNHYVHYDELIRELWPVNTCYPTVRSAVFRLKAKLREQGLEALADRIKGGVADHYGLMLDQ